MRKSYTLVQNGKQEGVGAGNQEVSFLLPAFKTDKTKDYLSKSRKIIVFSHLLLLSRSHVFTCIALSIAKKIETFPVSQLLFPSHFAVSTSAPRLAPTITNTDMYVYIWMFFFKSTVASTNHLQTR